MYRIFAIDPDSSMDVLCGEGHPIAGLARDISCYRDFGPRIAAN